MYRKRRYRKPRFRWTKFAVIWFLLLSFALGSHFYRYCQNQGIDCSELMLDSLTIVALLLVAIIVILCIYGVMHILHQRKLNRMPGFANQPWLSNNQAVEISGSVISVFPEQLKDRTHLTITNIWRKIVGSSDPTGRYRHQRFLLCSPELRRGETLLIVSNLEEQVPLVHKGDQVKIRGIYLHSPSKTRGFWGWKRTFYGRIHFTHPPKGYIEIVNQ